MNLLTDLTVSVYIKKKTVLHMTRTQTRVAQLCQWVANEMQFIFICKHCSKLEGFLWGKSAGGG